MEKTYFLKIYEEEHIKNGFSYSEIRNKYNIPRGTWDYYIRQKLGKNADQRKYRAVDNFFDIIDSEIKAYLLGFLYADGYISKDGRIGILLNVKDKEVIDLIHKFIAPNSPIQHLNYQNVKRDPQVKIRFKSKQIYKRLQEFGFTTDKTHTDCSILEKIPEDFKRHFIRGYLDGDGSIKYDEHISKQNPNKKWVSLGLVFCNGVPEILYEIQRYFKDIKGKIKKHSSWYTLEYYTKESTNKIYKELYLNCTYYLKRKYEKAINSINYCNNTELMQETKESCTV